MRKVIYMLLIIWLNLVLTACNGERWCAKHYPPEIYTHIDSFTQVELRDTVVFVEGETIRDTFRVECDSTGQVVVSGGNGDIRYVYRDRWLTLSAKCRDTAVIIPRYKQVVKVSKERSDVVKVPEVYMPWWVKILAWTGGIAVAWVAVRYAWKYLMMSV